MRCDSGGEQSEKVAAIDHSFLSEEVSCERLQVKVVAVIALDSRKQSRTWDDVRNYAHRLSGKSQPREV